MLACEIHLKCLLYFESVIYVTAEQIIVKDFYTSICYQALINIIKWISNDKLLRLKDFIIYPQSEQFYSSIGWNGVSKDALMNWYFYTI